MLPVYTATFITPQQPNRDIYEKGLSEVFDVLISSRPKNKKSDRASMMRKQKTEIPTTVPLRETKITTGWIII